ncbi:MAG: AcrB/AcrD/AcrF family protein [Nevskia sp.]|nr:AcrB/AcrD/AcrF family protein [Nevskia sp.]
MTDWLRAHQRSVLFLLAIAALAGVIAALQLPVGLFPNIDFPRVAVSVEAGDRSVDRMVVEVTQPLEQALRAVPGVTNIRSTSSRGAADLSINFDWGIDITTAQLQIESAMNRALVGLPAGTQYEARRMDPTVFPVLGLSLTSQAHDLVGLRDIAFYQLRPILSAVPGVAQVEVLGGALEEFQVLIDPARLSAAGVSVQEVATALSNNNVVTAIGRLEDRNRLYLTLSNNRIETLSDIAKIVLRAGRVGVLRVGDVAEIRQSSAPNWTRVTANGQDAVLINIRQNRGANTLQMVQAVRAQLSEHAGAVPADVKLGTYYDQSELVRAAATSVRDAILIGAILAAAVLMLFLQDLRLTLIVALVLPLVLAVTSLLMQLFGLTFNIMTLGGMAAAVGLVVDDAVVMVEHMVRRLRERDRADVDASLLPAAREMGRPLLGSSLATVLIFTPLSFLSGVSGGFFKALALTMASALVVSFLVALLAVPLMTDRLVRRQDTAKPNSQNRFERFAEQYARLLRASLRLPLGVTLAALLIVGAGGVAWTQMQSGFMPQMDEGGFTLDYYAAPGTSLTETDRLLRQVEVLIQATPEVNGYSRRTGLQLGGSLTEANEGDFFIHLKPTPRRDIEAVMSDLRGRIEAQVPGLHIETAQLMEDLIGDLTAVPQPIEVKLFGANLDALQTLAPQVAARLEKIEGVVEVQNGLRVAGDALEVHVDRVRAGLEGLDPDAVSKQLETLLGGTVVGVIQSGAKTVGLRLWSDAALRDRIEAIDQLRLRSPDGRDLPLSRVATISIASGQPQIVRENLEQMIAVTARLDGRDLGSAMNDVRVAVGQMKLPSSIRVEYGGLYSEQQKSFRGLTAVFGAALLLVTTLLLYLYERWAVVISILTAVLLCVASVFVGLWLTGTELDISAMMGMTMIIGIVTEIAIFYFAEIDTQESAEIEALIYAGRHRLRPILMTSLIGILALLPLALSIGAGSAMQAPLAIAIISGLFAALPVVLLIMPAIFAALAKQKRLAS